MKTAIVILNFNGREHLSQFLPSVLDHLSTDTTLYVADNGSNDGSLSWLENTYPDILKIDLKHNYGFAEGYNRALAQVEADIYVLLNSDVEVTHNWLAPMLQQFKANPQLAAAQPKILSYNQKQYFEYAGAAGGWLDYLGYPFCRGRIFDVNEKDNGQYDTEQSIFWASGAALFIRSTLFHEIGAFDPSYFAHSEEIDLCWRLQRAGFQIKCFPESTVYHLGGGTLNYQSPFKTFLNFRNSLYTLIKNESTLKLLWLIPSRLILDGIAGILFISQGKYQHLGAILKAHFSFYANFFKLLSRKRQERQRIQELSIRQKPTISGRYPGSLVFQYFIARKKHFRDLINVNKKDKVTQW